MQSSLACVYSNITSPPYVKKSKNSTQTSKLNIFHLPPAQTRLSSRHSHGIKINLPPERLSLRNTKSRIPPTQSESLMTPESISFIVSQSYGIPSVLLYLLTIFIILKHRNAAFGSSFFLLYIYDGAMNLFTFSLTFVTLKLNSITCRECLFAPFYQNIDKLLPLNLMNTMVFHMAYVQYAITTLLSFNRLTVLLNYNSIEPIWKKYTWLAILVIFCVPFLNTHIVWNYDVKIQYLEEKQYYSMDAEKLPREKILPVLTVFMVLATLSSVLINLTSILIVRNLKTQIRQKAEANFLVIMVITCLVQLLGTSITVALTVLEMSPFLMKLADALPFVSDGLTLVQPWLLVGFSQAVRHQVKICLGCPPNPANNPMFQMRSITLNVGTG